MVKFLTLTNENAIALYNFLSNARLDRVKNRARWKFLDVIEEKVFSYERVLNNIRNEVNKANRELNTIINDKEVGREDKQAKEVEVAKFISDAEESTKGLSKQVLTFKFNDREIFAEVKAVFEGVGDNLSGRDGRMYREIEDAFMNVKELDETPAVNQEALDNDSEKALS